jgi:hypothetical protein
MTTRSPLTYAQRLARGEHWGLPLEHLHRLAALDSVEAVQDMVAAIPINFEDHTCWSAQQVMQRNVAMCIEGAFVAAAALQLQGRPPLLLRMFASDGEDHAIVLFLHGGRWGAISKTNHLWCRWRDPVYLSVRELVMSYLHEHVTGPVKTLIAYSDPLDLRCVSPQRWITREDSCIDVAELLCRGGCHPLMEVGKMALRHRDALELAGDAIVEHAPRALCV